ncbi:MAG: glycosyltransferase family 4 protein [Verrucomicrobiota bacterium]
MRLAILHHQFGIGGGLERYLGHLVKGLVARGHRLDVIAGRVAGERPEGVSFHELGRFPVSRTWRMIDFVKRAEAKAASLEVDWRLGFGLTGVQDIHRAGGGCHAEYSALLPWWKRWAPKNLVERSLEKRRYTGGGTRHFAVNSFQVAEQLSRRYDVDPERFTVLHTAVDSDLYHPATGGAQRAQFCQDQGIEPSRPLFLFASFDHKRKGLGALLEAWPGLSGTLCVAGEWPDGFWLRQVQRYGLQERIRWLGPDLVLAEVLQSVDAFVHPTRYDACANTALQAMASGLPCLLSARDGVQDQVRDRENAFRLEDPEDPAQLHALLLEMEQSPRERLEALGRAARETVVPLTAARHLDAWESLFERLASGRA